MSSTTKKRTSVSLPIQLVIALAAGTAFGILLPQFSTFYNFLGTAFINLITMIVIPLVFPIVVVSVASVLVKKSFGSLLGKSFVYYFAVTTLIILLFVVAGYYLGFGNNFAAQESPASLEGIETSVNFSEFLLQLIPGNFFAALSEGSLLPVIVFAIFLGLGLGTLKEKSKPLLDLFNIWIDAVYVITNFVVKLLPIGVFGFIAEDVATAGLDSLLSLGQFVLGVYIGYLILALVIFPLIAKIFGVRYLSLTKQIWDLLVLAFVSGSSSVVLPQLLERLKTVGHQPETVSVVVPLGYTFNLDGAAVYLSLATVFIANVYNIELTTGALLLTVLLLTVIGKTIATIPSGAIVVLLATATQLGLPQEGVALIFAVDFFANAGRTALNVLGNALAVGVLETLEPIPETEALSGDSSSETPEASEPK